MSAIVDRARDTWERITPRERRLVVLAAIAAPLTIALWLGLEIHDGLAAMEARNEQTRKALAVLADLRARGPAEPVDDVVATMGTEALSLDTYLDKAAKKAGFTLKGTTPRPTATRGGFVTSSVSCQLDDLTIEQLGAFLQEVETASRVVVVTHLDVRRDFKAKDKLDASLEVTTYAKEAPAKAEAPGEGSAAGSDEKKGS